MRYYRFKEDNGSFAHGLGRGISMGFMMAFVRNPILWLILLPFVIVCAPVYWLVSLLPKTSSTVYTTSPEDYDRIEYIGE